MSTKGLLTIVIILLLGTFAAVVINMNEKSPGKELTSSISEMTEEISDEIDDHTDAR